MSVHVEMVEASQPIPSQPRASLQVVVDLGSTTDLDESLISRLNHAFHRAAATGYTFQVVPPEAAAPRHAFLRAALRGQFAWAAGTALHPVAQQI
ncbi:hypothetical protein [Sporichthya polymorpha]|uniref:hypothetical protein n=1 Tax=Sporichthya polymorpha TaxID=35751 RepID=UPI0003753DD3|nr:hypothetical protein [Sporichthya polymorpha]